jgi:predicted SprT family Zn-dependent metalloprotease
MITDEMIMVELEQGRQEALRKFPHAAFRLTRVRFEINDQITYMGVCYWYELKIVISRAFFKESLENLGALRNTIRHEFAHMVSPSGEGHGRIWKQNARILGANPRRCSGLTIAAVTSYEGKCCNCGKAIRLTKVRYNKWRRGDGMYLCSRNCR